MKRGETVGLWKPGGVRNIEATTKCPYFITQLHTATKNTKKCRKRLQNDA